MGAESADGTVITFDGETIGGLVSYELLAGEEKVATYTTLKGATTSQPTATDYGRCILNLNRDLLDAGQIKLAESLKNRTRATCVVTYKGGGSQTFNAFCTLFNTRGGKTPDAPVNTSRAILRINGAIT